MRRLAIFLIITGVIISSCSNKETTRLQGRISNLEVNSVCYLEELRGASTRVVDSIELGKNGRFKYEIDINYPGYYQFSISSGQMLTLILSPGEKVELTADMNDFYKSKILKGSQNSRKLNTLHDSLRKSVVELRKLEIGYSKLDTLPDVDVEEKKSLEEKYEAIQLKHHRYSTSLILEDLNSLVNLGALYQQYRPDEYVFNTTRDLQYFKLVTDSLSKYYPRVKMVKTLQSNYKSLLSDYSTRRLLSNTDTKIENFPNILLPDSKGKITPLLSLKQKYVLVTFWSVVHQESVQNTLDLKKIYKKYKGKNFEIYQVALDKSIGRWKASLAFEEIEWVSVCDTLYPNSQTRALFNVDQVPMNYLIDIEKEEILAKNLAPESLDQTLGYLFK